MKNSDIKIKYLEKINQLEKYNNLYYNKSSPIVDDSDYDKLKKEILDIEKKYSFLRFR